MVVGLLISSSGKIKEIMIKSKEEDYYKLVNLNNSDGFELKHKWSVELDKKYNIQVYARTNGKAGTENKFEFPPPIDQELFFGSCLLVNKNKEELANLTADNWEDIYNYLYGGFEDLEDEEEEESEDESEDEDVELTKEGYKKDDFIVDDEVSDSDDDDDSEETLSTNEDTEEEVPSDDDCEELSNKKRTKKIKKVKIIQTCEELPKDELECIDISGELEEEEYV